MSLIWQLMKPTFSQNEDWGDPSKITHILLFTMYRIRIATAQSIHIHNAWTDGKGHTDGSEHYKGNATDFHFTKISLKVAIPLLEKTILDLGIADEIGLGIYPYWNSPGFHLDCRGKKSRWGRLAGDKEYVYYEEAR